MKYKVVHDCYGFRGSYWVEGEMVEVLDSETVPVYFQPVEPIAPKVEEKNEIIEANVSINESPDKGLLKRKTSKKQRGR